MTQGKRRASEKKYTKLNANTRQKKGEKKKTQKQENSRAESKARKNITKTTTLFSFTKMLQSRKKRRKKNNRKKIFRTENKHIANRKNPKGLQNGKTKQQEVNLGNETSCQQNNFFFRFQFLKIKPTN